MALPRRGSVGPLREDQIVLPQSEAVASRSLGYSVAATERLDELHREDQSPPGSPQPG
jgi:hypothetical protein